MRWLFAERCVVWIAIVFGVSIMWTIIDHPEITVSSRFHPVNSLAPAASAAVLSTPRQQRPLPQRKPREGSHKNGGIILFIHVPKTGGTSFAPSLMSRDYIAYVHDAVPQVLEGVKEAVRSPELSVGKHETIFAEVHIPVPAIGKFQHQIDTWRDLAASQGIPFFVFSMVRDPIHYAVSWFEFFCINKQNVAGAKAMCGDSKVVADPGRAALDNRVNHVMDGFLAEECGIARSGVMEDPKYDEKLTEALDRIRELRSWRGRRVQR